MSFYFKYYLETDIKLIYCIIAYMFVINIYECFRFIIYK